MPAVAPMVKDSALARTLVPGDTMMTGKNLTAGAITTVGAGVWTGAAIASGIIRRTGPGAGYADVTDSANNILAAISGNMAGAGVVKDHSWELLVQNTVAFANTVTGGAGVTMGTGVNIAASLCRNYLVTCTNPSPEVSVTNAVTTSGSKIVTFNQPSGQSALPQGGNPGSFNITPGQAVTGTGIAANTTVASVDQGLGGIIGVHLDTNATATGTVTLTFGPTFRIDSLFSTTL